MNWYLEAWRRYKDFGSRSHRTEYWTFVVINIGISLALGLFEFMFGMLGILNWLYSLAVLLPALAVGVRRLHDTGREGLWVLGLFVPFLNLVVLYFLTLEGERRANRYGENPLRG